MQGTEILTIFKENDLKYFTGVPDSTFAGFINELYLDNDITHRIAVNECEAVFLAGGYNVSTGNNGVVYMQNAGLGKAVNPITSYLKPYEIPMLFMIGWRGQPGLTSLFLPDEPQHIPMGEITLKLLDLLKIPYEILSNDLIEVEAQIRGAQMYMETEKSSCALIIPQKNKIVGKKFSAMDSFFEGNKKGNISREDVVKAVVHNMKSEDIIVSTTGKVSRELYEFREENGGDHSKDFLNVGGMGGALAQAIEIALQHPDRKVYCLDGDGAALMQLGTMIIAGHYHPKNLIHIIINNGCYQSTGNQPNISNSMHFGAIGITCGYKNIGTAFFYQQFYEYLEDFKNKDGPSLIIAHCGKQCRSNLGRPSTTPLDNKKGFMKNLIGKSL